MKYSTNTKGELLATSTHGHYTSNGDYLFYFGDLPKYTKKKERLTDYINKTYPNKFFTFLRCDRSVTSVPSRVLKSIIVEKKKITDIDIRISIVIAKGNILVLEFVVENSPKKFRVCFELTEIELLRQFASYGSKKYTKIIIDDLLDILYEICHNHKLNLNKKWYDALENGILVSLINEDGAEIENIYYPFN